MQKRGEVLLAERQKQEQQLRQQVERMYKDRDYRYWQKRYAEATTGGPALWVLGISSQYTTVLKHSLAELGRAVTESGHEFRLCVEEDEHSLENPWFRQIAEFQPDLIVQISRMRYENPEMLRNVPFLSWDQDNLSCMRDPRAGESLDRLTYVAGHAAENGYFHMGWPKRNCILCLPATMISSSSRQKAAELPADAPRYDFSYISSASDPAEKLAESKASRWSEDCLERTLFNEIIASFLQPLAQGESRRWKDIDEAAKRRRAEFGAKMCDAAFADVRQEAMLVFDRAFRHASLRWVKRWCEQHGATLALFGHGWQNHPEFAPFAKGPVQPGEATRRVHLASAINLQIIETGFVHSRSLDALADGGFVLHGVSALEDYRSWPIYPTMERLTRWIEEHHLTSPQQIRSCTDAQIQTDWQLATYLYPGEDMAFKAAQAKVYRSLPPTLLLFRHLPDLTFSTEAEFDKLADKFAGNAEARRAIAEEMRQVVQDHFSVEARWKQFLQGIIAGLND